MCAKISSELLFSLPQLENISSWNIWVYLIILRNPQDRRWLVQNIILQLLFSLNLCQNCTQGFGHDCNSSGDYFLALLTWLFRPETCIADRVSSWHTRSDNPFHPACRLILCQRWDYTYLQVLIKRSQLLSDDLKVPSSILSLVTSLVLLFVLLGE